MPKIAVEKADTTSDTLAEPSDGDAGAAADEDASIDGQDVQLSAGPVAPAVPKSDAFISDALIPVAMTAEVHGVNPPEEQPASPSATLSPSSPDLAQQNLILNQRITQYVQAIKQAQNMSRKDVAAQLMAKLKILSNMREQLKSGTPICLEDLPPPLDGPKRSAAAPAKLDLPQSLSAKVQVSASTSSLPTSSAAPIELKSGATSFTQIEAQLQKQIDVRMAHALVTGGLTVQCAR